MVCWWGYLHMPLSTNHHRSHKSRLELLRGRSSPKRTHTPHKFAADPLLHSRDFEICSAILLSDGDNKLSLQISPGVYDENVFQALNFVVLEAAKNKIRLILSLVNNYQDFGGRPQYVDWARNAGTQTSSDDAFYTNVVVKQYYKNHVKAWVQEMASYVKFIDNKHLLEISMEGFYGDSITDRKQYNPGYHP
ncbi:Mannan endo-1,4-beta-mannosidase 2 [Sesamum angolense]|uniref:mannan endo-1,4-beta-mannosidase n=1 Tax=Sesamum angolense TaxID=2727404 RepID=A0AAE1WDA8_9LAMI|nr:Mannan endo-1,4-beta-mannosidase 2 [Sesamum angolense]